MLPRSFTRRHRWGYHIARAFSVIILAAGVMMLILTHSSINQTSARPASPFRIAPFVPEGQWGRWHNTEVGRTFPTRSSPFASGQTVVIPSVASIQVDEVDRNWQPQPWQEAPFEAGGQDDARGKEIILVRFTITNLSSGDMPYYDGYFTLIRGDGTRHEQKVASLNELGPDQYGAFLRFNPWLRAGASTHTFVPFIVNRGEQPLQFLFSYFTLATETIPGQVIVAPNGQGGSKVIPVWKQKFTGVARVGFDLQSPASALQAAHPATFVSNTTFTVGSGDVYSPTPQS